MILVIADDFTGAAEMAAVACRYGLSAQVQTELDLTHVPTMISLDTDSRSLPPDEAAKTLRGALEGAAGSWPDVFKKVDSALRGPVLAELVTLMEILGKERTVLIPANPSLGRVIRGGRYFIQDIPIEKTDFGRDPEHPVRSSDVLEMVGRFASSRAFLATTADRLESKGVFIGEVDSERDLAIWAEKLDKQTLAAGAADFFAATLHSNGYQERDRVPFRAAPDKGLKALFVGGSSSDYSRALSERFRRFRLPVCPIPESLFEETSEVESKLDQWSQQVLTSLASSTVARVTIDRPVVHRLKLSQRLTGQLIRLVQKVLCRGEVHYLCVEGGATVSALTRQLGWKRLTVLAELATGCVVLQPLGRNGPLLITKPGSYSWPPEFLSSYLPDPAGEPW